MQQDRHRRIRELFDEYIELYAARDNRLIAHFSENFTGFTGSRGLLVQDRDEWIHITRQDFAQVPGRLRLEVLDVALQDLSDVVVSVAATLHIHLPESDGLLANEVARLVLVFRLEGAAWMITHCSYSVPFQRTQDDEVFPLKSLQEENIALQALVAERTRELHESQAFYRMLTEDAEDVHWRMDRDFIVTYISPADERLRGFRADEVVGRSLFELLTEEASDLVRELLNPGTLDDPSSGTTGFRKFEMQCWRRPKTEPRMRGVPI